MVVERDDIDQIDAGGFEQFEFLLERGEPARRRFGPHDLRRVAIEGDHGAAGAPALGEMTDLVEDRAVTEVDAVVGANGQGGAAVADEGAGGGGISDNLHGDTKR